MDVSVLVLRPFLAALRARSIDTDAMLRAVRIDPALCEDPGARVALDRVKRFWQAVPRAAGEATFGWSVAKFVSPTTFHLLSYISKSSASTGSALRNVQQYSSLLLRDSECRLLVDGDRATICFVYPQPLPRVVSDFATAMAVRMGEMLTGQRLPLHEIQLSYRRPPEALEYMRTFGVPVRFGCAHDGLVCSVDFLEMPILDADEQLCEILKSEAERTLQSHSTSTSLAESIRRTVASELTGGRPGLDQVARRLGIGSRTIRRRLLQGGTSYSEILDEVRRTRALVYLEEEGRTVSEVATLLGFANQSAFHRAFQRWQGQGPQQWKSGAKVRE
jgi:AraC-like DNA-binding protein